MATRLLEVDVDQFISSLARIHETSPVILFSATKKEDGNPWCPDCQTADPVVESQLGELSDGVEVMRVRVSRPYWKETPSNVLKEDYNIKCLPTLMRWGQPERLGEEECKSEETVREFLKQQKM